MPAYGQMLTLTATVGPAPAYFGTPTGTVVFTDAMTSTTLGTANLSDGVASISTASLPVGNHMITAAYSGDANFQASISQVTQGTIITTIAGIGTAYGNGVPATAAALARPGSAAVDNAGHVFIADSGNNMVREITLATGVITTVAGTGASGFSGDGGPATAATLNSPDGVAVDNSGDLFIADTNNNCIREVNLTSGTITTVAGNGIAGFYGDAGPATAAELNAPYGIAVDTSGNLFIADTSNNVVREVTAADGKINTVAGNGVDGFSGDSGQATDAHMSAPHGVAVDTTGHLFIADTNNNRIREVNLSSGQITTFAGNGTQGYQGDSGLASSAELNMPQGVALDGTGDLFIADTFNCVVRQVVVSSTQISTVAGSGSSGFSGDGGSAVSAALNFPYAVAADSSGHVFVADFFNNRIREVSGGNISTIAGNGTYGFAGDNNTATNATLNYPSGIAADAAGHVFIADTLNNRVREIDLFTGIITTVAGNGTAGYSGDNGKATAAELNSPNGLAVDSSGHLFIADTNNNRIREVNLSTGVITTVAGDGVSGYSGDSGEATLAKLDQPDGVAVDTSGDLYIADTWNNAVRKVVLSSDTISTIAGNGSTGFSGDGGLAVSATLNAPKGVVVDSSGHLYIADTYNNRIREVDLLGGTINTIAGRASQGSQGDGGLATAAQLNSPQSLALDAAGNLFIADTLSNRVRVIDLATGVINAAAGTGFAGFSGDNGAATAAQMRQVAGVAVDAFGNLFIADDYNDRIREVPAAAQISVLQVGTQIMDTTEPGFWANANWTASGQGLDGASLVSNSTPGSKQSMAAWWFSMPAGTYDISISYVAGSSLSTDLALDFYNGGAWLGTASVNERVAPSDFSDQGVSWKRLGSFKITSNIFHISTWNSASDGQISIDAIQLRAAPIVDNADVPGPTSSDSFATTGAWSPNSSGTFGSSLTSSSTAGNGASIATWSMPVTPGSYQLAATWVNASTLSASATYNVYDGTTLLGSVTVNQQNAPASFTDEGQNWGWLGTFNVSGTQLRVTLANSSADGQVSADAVRILPVPQTASIVNDTYPGCWISSAWNTVNQGLYGESLVSNSTAGSKQSQVAWWFPCRPGTYDVAVTWPAASNLSSATSFDIYNGTTWIRGVAVNQKIAPSDFVDQGVGWYRLGVFTITTNVFHVSMWNSELDGAICADAIRLMPVQPQLAAGSAADAAPAALLTASQLQPIIAAAENRWAAAGIPSALLQRLDQTKVEVADLPAGYLGATEDGQILISPTAAGYGWFVDPTPNQDEEFAPVAGSTNLKAIDPRAVDRIDLLTVVEHEMGHILGETDVDSAVDTLMSTQLQPGIRRLV
jgi:sugar lactone lactonase YvrE